MSYDRTKVDLTNCDREPIHIPGSVQPHGAMVVVDDETGLVSFVSANVNEFLGDTNRDYNGAELADVVGAGVAHNVANAVAKAGSGQIAAVVLKADMVTAVSLRTLPFTVMKVEHSLSSNARLHWRIPRSPFT